MPHTPARAPADVDPSISAWACGERSGDRVQLVGPGEILDVTTGSGQEFAIFKTAQRASDVIAVHALLRLIDTEIKWGGNAATDESLSVRHFGRYNSLIQGL